jgi:hypothetical protein
MWTLIGFAAAGLAAFAIFVLQTDAWERKRDAERKTAERAQ